MEEGMRIQSGRREGFTVLYNSMITDRRLSLQSKGLFAVMTSRPDNWAFTVSGLAAFTGVSKDTVRKLLGELEKVGYLVREQTHNESGHFAGNLYVLQDVAPPLSENTDNGENRQRKTPSTVFSAQTNKDKTKYIPPYNPPKGEREPMEYDPAFVRFWEVYPKRKAKAAAWKAWRRLRPSPATVRQMLEAIDRQRKSEEWTKEGGKYVPYPASWINGRRWEDEAPPETGGEESGVQFGWR